MSTPRPLAAIYNHLMAHSGSFDEVHFGKFASHYIKREYYFDVHPPLAKLLYGLAGWFVGFDGEFKFETIGDSYTENHVPYVGMRSLPAMLGSMTVPIVYAIMKESGYSTIIAAFSACLILFGASVRTTTTRCTQANARVRSQIMLISLNHASFSWTPR